MNRIVSLMILGLVVFLAACGGSPSQVGVGPSQYSVTGTVVDKEGDPIEGVTLSFGSFGVAVTDAAGRWSKDGLSGTVTIQPAKDGWVFTPKSLTVDGAKSDIWFVGEIDAQSLDAEVIVTEALVDPNPAWAESMYHDRVQLTLRNVGGPGFFKVQFWGTRPNVINPPLEMFAETEVYEVNVGWTDTASWDVPTPSTSITHTYIKEVVVLTRNAGELSYRETARVKPTMDENL